jgi:hypothetical protein
MKKTLFVVIFIVILCNSYSQDYDLIVTEKGDSIACHIDSVSDELVNFEMKYKNNWVNTNLQRDAIIEFKYGVINKDKVIFKPGGSYIDIIVGDDAILTKALKRKKTGKTLTIAGVGAVAVGTVVLFSAGSLAGVGVATFINIGGIGLMSVGIPLLISSRKLLNISNTACNNIKLDLIPGIHHCYLTESCHAGLTIRINF